MEETRISLQDKLETLEQQVKETVQGAAEAATETVQTVKEAVQETVGTVKDTVQETVQSVRQTFDLRRQVEKHPWPMFIGATMVGFVSTRVLSRALDTTSQAGVPKTFAAMPSPGPSFLHRNGADNGVVAGSSAAAIPDKPGFLGKIAEHYSDELAKLKGLAIGALGNVVRETLTTGVSPALSQQIAEIVDNVTVKLGGQPIREPLLRPAAGTTPASTSARASYEHRYDKTEAMPVARLMP
jgi:ElaB/YqjD/DUF883 family membrane-anchored ribosome-binding protein